MGLFYDCPMNYVKCLNSASQIIKNFNFVPKTPKIIILLRKQMANGNYHNFRVFVKNYMSIGAEISKMLRVIFHLFSSIYLTKRHF